MIGTGPCQMSWTEYCTTGINTFLDLMEARLVVLENERRANDAAMKK